MLKLVWYLFAVGVFLSEVKSDIICYQRRLNERVKGILRILSDVDTFCGNYEHYISRLRQDVRDCEVDHISVDGYEALFKDFCADVSGLKTTFQANEVCLIEKNICTNDLNKNAGWSVEEKLRIECWKLPSIMECYRDNVGKPCGAEHLIDRYTQAFESYYKGLCAEVGGASTNKAFTWSLLGILFAVMAWWY